MNRWRRRGRRACGGGGDGGGDGGGGGSAVGSEAAGSAAGSEAAATEVATEAVATEAVAAAAQSQALALKMGLSLMQYAGPPGTQGLHWLWSVGSAEFAPCRRIAALAAPTGRTSSRFAPTALAVASGAQMNVHTGLVGMWSRT